MNSRDIIHAITRDIWQPISFDVTYNTGMVTGHEADILVLSKAGYINEIEVKISLSDFKADFTKKSNKHEELQKGRAPRRWHAGAYHREWDKATPHCVRYFWFAIPIELQTKIEPILPCYCGLIVVNHVATIVKRAPVLKMSRKATDKERMFILKAMYHRGWNKFKEDYSARQENQN